MTREEAIARIKGHMFIHKMNEPRAIHISEALDMAIKALEQGPILDKIRAEIEQEYLAEGHLSDYWDAIDKCLQIVDKYKAESEDKE